MRSVYIASTEGSGGKTTTAIGLCLALRRRGLKAGYFKPIGIASQGTSRSDDDVTFVADVLELDESPGDLCPVLLDEDALHHVLAGSDVDAMQRIGAAFERVRAGKDVVVCEGLGEIWQGRFLRTSGADIVRELDLATLLVARFVGARLLDDACYVKDALKEHLLGVIFNMVPDARVALVEGEYTEFLAGYEIGNFGVLPASSLLAAVPVAEIASALQGTFICGEDHGDALAETYLVGAMSPEHALRYFQEAASKIVVVGGDRAEIVLAALETPTAAIVLTGSYVPGPAVVARAEEVGVALISVSTDTVAACDVIRRLFGSLGGHDRRKIEHVSELVERCVDVDRLIAALKA